MTSSRPAGTSEVSVENVASRSSGSRRSPHAVIAVLAACGLMMTLQQSLVLPILPALPSLIGTSASNASWLVTATLVSGAVATPLLGRLADLFGKRRLITIILVVVIAASLLGALSNHLLPLLIARALQGCGLALVPVAIATMRDILPAAQLPSGVAAMTASLAIGASAGLPLGGTIVTLLDWHWIFWVTVISGSILLVLILRLVPAAPAQAGARFDLLGAAVLAGTLTTVLLAISKGSQWGWTSWETVALIVAGLSLLGLWVPLQLRSRAPLVNLRLAARPPVSLVNISSTLIGFALFSNVLVTVQLLQLPTETGFGAGMSALSAGLWMVPATLIGAVVAPIAARCITRFGAASVLLVASAMLSVIFLGRVWLSESAAQILVGSVLAGAALAFANASIPTMATRLVPHNETASANSIVALLRSVGTSTASAVMAAGATVWTVTIGSELYAGYGAFAAMFWVSAGTTLAATVCAASIILLARRRPT